MADKNKLQRALSLLQSIDRDDATNQNFDLDNWITDFENGFPRFTKNSPEFKEHYWGLGLENRPKIYELNVESDAQKIEGYRLIELFPDRDNKSESYLLFGTPLELMTQCSQLMNQWLMIRRNSTGGEYVGWAVNEYLLNSPRIGLTVTVFLTTKKNPPFYKKKGEVYHESQITIPFANKSKFTYTSIRQACNGVSGLNWGKWQARGYLQLPNSSDRTQMVVGGSTKANAESNFKRFLPFTEAKLIKLNTNEVTIPEAEKAQTGNSSVKNYEVFPAWIVVLNSKLVAYNNSQKGRKTMLGKQVEEKKRLFIYQAKEPSAWQTRFANLTKTPQS